MFLHPSDRRNSTNGLCLSLGLSLLALCIHLVRIDHPQHWKTYGRIVPFFDSTFNPVDENDSLLLLHHQTIPPCTMLESYVISYSCATKPHPGRGLNVSSTPFLGYPRGRLPLFIIINLLAGDINLNPGPSVVNDTQSMPKSRRGRKPKWPCGMCGYSVTNTTCIQCSNCDANTHGTILTVLTYQMKP